MLKLKHLIENFDLAKEILTHWEHEPEKLDQSLSWFRISSNAIYPFFCKGELCFLRLAPTDEKEKRNLLGELEFIDYLRAHDFPALCPVPAKTGERLLTLSTRWGEYYACAFQKVPGKQIEDTELTDEVLYEYGKTLGRLHVLSDSYAPKTGKWTHADALDWTEIVLRDYHAPEQLHTALAALRKELSALPIDRDYGLVHYDFETDNVFYDPETKRCAVIDFEDGMYHWYALDIEQALDSLAEQFSEETFPQAQKIFLCGYQSVRALPEKLEELRPLMRRFCALYGYARVLRSVSEKPEVVPDWMEELEGTLRGIMAERGNMVI